MKISDIKINRYETFSLQFEKDIKISKDTECKIYENNDKYYYEDANNKAINVEPKSNKDKSALDKALQSRSIFAIIKSHKNEILVSAKIFISKISFDEKIIFGITDGIFNDVKKRYLSTENNKKIEEWFNNQFLIHSFIKNKSYILISGNYANKENSFRIHGIKNKTIDVKRNKDDKFEILRIINNSKVKPLHLGIVEASFKDISEATKARGIIQDQLKNIDSNKRYTELWKEYSEIENQFIIENAREIGNIEYSSFRYSKTNEFIFLISEKVEKFKKGDYFETHIEPVVFSNDIFSDKEKKEKVFKAKFSKILNNEIYLIKDDENEIKPPVKGYISLSLLGDKVRIKRRNDASEKIKNGDIPMPKISMILEEKPVSSKQSKPIKAVTKIVLDQFDGGKPNVMQEKAIEIAINTPEIALIQGPPGTGKTKVINAISQRLIEICRKNGEDPRKSILLTSFQHDAVENVAAGTNILGLPTLKFGKQSETYKPFVNWQNNISEKLQAKLSELGETPLEKKYKDLRKKYISFINEVWANTEIKQNFEYIKNEFSAHLSQTILNKIDDFIQKLGIKSPEYKNTEKFRKLVNAIRTNKITYSDDGQKNIYLLLKHIEKNKIKILKTNIIFLNQLLDYEETKEISEEEFQMLEKIKNNLIDTIIDNTETPKQIFANLEVRNLFEEILDELYQKSKNEGGVSTVLNELLDDIKSDPDRTKKTIKEYVTVLSATVQGSVSNQVGSLFEEEILFDTVIVDEAARTNPLDLFIPLTLAKRRIILVGDHRQLPQILEPKVEKELEKNREDDFKEALEKSLFERLFDSLRKQEKEDDIQRVITLNTQYRMHPKIGKFISKHFYEKYGDPEIFSGLTEEQCSHNIEKYKGQVAKWIDIDDSNGNEIYNGSYYRKTEAKRIVLEAKEILDNNPTYSVGIITFYSAQREEIFKIAKSKKMVTKNEADEWIISQNYKNLQNSEDERLRIGSVDAFQGKEFDVVLLSPVRSNNKKEENEEIRLRKKFGFLMLENRLNVAMSRAKKLLIICGNKDMYNTKDAKNAVPGLYYFINELI